MCAQHWLQGLTFVSLRSGIFDKCRKFGKNIHSSSVGLRVLWRKFQVSRKQKSEWWSPYTSLQEMAFCKKQPMLPSRESFKPNISEANKSTLLLSEPSICLEQCLKQPKATRKGSFSRAVTQWSTEAKNGTLLPAFCLQEIVLKLTFYSPRKSRAPDPLIEEEGLPH